MTEIVGVVPAAGRAERLQPLDGSKEVLSVRGRPIIDHLVERMRLGGCTRLRVVTRAEKRDVVDHCAALAAEVVIASPATVGESLAAGVVGLDLADIALVGFPDTLWEPPDGYVPLVRAVLEGCDVALGLFRIRKDELSRSDVVEVGGDHRVRRVQVKPRDPASDLIWGCAAFRVGILSGIERSEWPGEYVDALCRDGRDVRGYLLSDEWLDVGTKSALEEVRSPSPRPPDPR